MVDKNYIFFEIPLINIYLITIHFYNLINTTKSSIYYILFIRFLSKYYFEFINHWKTKINSNILLYTYHILLKYWLILFLKLLHFLNWSNWIFWICCPSLAFLFFKSLTFFLYVSMDSYFYFKRVVSSWIVLVRTFFSTADCCSFDRVWDEKDFLLFSVWEDCKLVELLRNLILLLMLISVICS